MTAEKLTRITSSPRVCRPGHQFGVRWRFPTAHLLLVPIHLARTHTIARLVLPSPFLFERAHELNPEPGVAGEHFATDIATIH